MQMPLSCPAHFPSSVFLFGSSHVMFSSWGSKNRILLKGVNSKGKRCLSLARVHSCFKRSCCWGLAVCLSKEMKRKSVKGFAVWLTKLCGLVCCSQIESSHVIKEDKNTWNAVFESQFPPPQHSEYSCVEKKAAAQIKPECVITCPWKAVKSISVFHLL